MSDELLERCVHVRALPSTVFSYFEDSKRFASWWGEGSTIDPRPGGAVRIAYPGGVVVSGEVLAIDAPHSIVFTYGYEEGQGPVPPGSTTVTITLEPHSLGTLLKLTHAFADPSARDVHVPGWRHQLAVFAGVVTRVQNDDLDGLFDRFFAAQLVEEESERVAALEPLVSEDFSFRDTFACVQGTGEFAAYLEAARDHGMALLIERDGPVRHCQGTAVCDWLVRQGDGAVFLRGTNVANLAPDGRLADVCGFWEVPGR